MRLDKKLNQLNTKNTQFDAEQGEKNPRLIANVKVLDATFNGLPARTIRGFPAPLGRKLAKIVSVAWL